MLQSLSSEVHTTDAGSVGKATASHYPTRRDTCPRLLRHSPTRQTVTVGVPHVHIPTSSRPKQCSWLKHSGAG